MKQARTNVRSVLERAMALHQQGDAARAEAMYRDVLAIDPDEPNAWHLLGVAAWQRGDLALAERNIRKAIALNDGAAAYCNNLAGVLRQKGDMAGAAEQYETALKLAPGDDTARKGLSQSLHDHGLKMAHDRRWEEAKAAYRRVLELEPGNIATLNNLATILQHQNDRAAARALYDRVLAAAPGNLLVRYNRGICLLTEQRLPEGWADFTASEAHWKYMQDKRAGLPWIELPLWNGRDDLRGKSILVWGDLGIGDEIVYAGMIPELIERGARVTIECNERLVPLLARSFPGTEPVARQAPPLIGNAFDYHAPGLWLASRLRPALDSFPRRAPFLKADSEKIARLRKRYEDFGKKHIVGLSWYTQSYAWGVPRSMQLPDMLKQLPLSDMLVVDLQYGDTADAWRQARDMFPELTVFHDPEVDQFRDMDIYAAQVAACDCVVSICNTTSHVAGALGVPGSILMPDVGLTWYWFERGEDCPWYPSLKLLRPDAPGRFETVVEMIKGGKYSDSR